MDCKITHNGTFRSKTNFNSHKLGKKKPNKISQCKYSILPPSQKKNNILPESDDCCFLRFACGSLLPSFNFLLPSLCLELITSTPNSFYLQRGMSCFMQTQKTDLFLLKLFLILFIVHHH